MHDPLKLKVPVQVIHAPHEFNEINEADLDNEPRVPDYVP
jgi:hypothetical protein